MKSTVLARTALARTAVFHAGAGGLLLGALLLGLLLLGGLLLSGCASTPDTVGGPGPTVHRPLTGTWTLTSGTDAQGTMGIQDTVVTLTLDGKKSHGTGPCNGYGVEVVGDTGAVTITEGVHTEMACTQQYRNALETRYFDALAKVDHADYLGKGLVLSGNGVELDFAPAD